MAERASGIKRRRRPAAGLGGGAPVAPNDRRRLHGSIAHDIAVRIVRGEYRPGDVLPNEDLFSRSLSVSRGAYREALRILAAKGLLESRPKTGTRIADRARWNMIDPDVLAWHFEAEPSEGFIRALFEVRLMVEPPAAALAAERRGEADLAAMRAALDVMRLEKVSTERGLAADLAFHHAVIAAAHNEPLGSLSSSIGATIRWSTLLKATRRGLGRDPMPEHDAVLRAIEAGDAHAARAAMEALVDLALADTVEPLSAAGERISGAGS